MRVFTGGTVEYFDRCAVSAEVVPVIFGVTHCFPCGDVYNSGDTKPVCTLECLYSRCGGRSITLAAVSTYGLIYFDNFQSDICGGQVVTAVRQNDGCLWQVEVAADDSAVGNIVSAGCQST